MATPSLSAIFNFVKKYPITLCGFSLLFMPSVYRLLLYFTPLLLSTAIFIVAMISWGPTASSDKRTTRTTGKPKLAGERHEWAFHETMGMDEEEEEEEEENEEEEAITQTEPHLGSKLRGELEPDPDLSGELDGSLEGTTCEAEPDPDLAKEGGDGPGTAPASGSKFLADPEYPDLGRDESSGAGTAADRHAEPDPDLLEGAGTAPNDDDAYLHAGRERGEESIGAGKAADRHAEPDPDLLGEGVGTAASKDGARLHAGEHAEHDGDGHVLEMGPAHDKSHDAHDYDDSHAGRTPGHTHDHKHEQGGVPMVERLPEYLQACA